MTAWIKSLVELQKIDSDIELLEKKVAAVPFVKKDLEHQKQAAADELAKEKKILQNAEMELKRLEMEAQSLTDKISKAQVQSNLVKKNDEYNALLKEIEDTNTKLGETEEAELELMEKLETMREQVKVADNVYKRKLAEIDEKAKSLSGKLVEFEEKLAKDKKMREGAVVGIDEDKLSMYERLHSGKKGAVKAIASLGEDGMCGSCHLKNRPESHIDVMKQKLVLCEHCSAILYDEKAL